MFTFGLVRTYRCLLIADPLRGKKEKGLASARPPADSRAVSRTWLGARPRPPVRLMRPGRTGGPSWRDEHTDDRSKCQSAGLEPRWRWNATRSGAGGVRART